MNKYKLPISLWWIVILLCITGCDSEQMIDYYCEKDNYISATGVVTHITYSNSMDQIYIAFDEMDYSFSDNNFKIVGKSLTIAQENGLDAKLDIGDKVVFCCAPRYFGDGYVIPIVALSVEGEVLLDMDEGIVNLGEWLSE